MLLFAGKKSYAQNPEIKIVGTIAVDTSYIYEQLVLAGKLFEQHPDSAIAIYKNCLGNSKKQKYVNGIVGSALALCDIYMAYQQYSVAANYVKDALSYVNDNTYYYVAAYIRLGNIYNDQFQHKEAFKAYQKAAFFAQKYPAKLAVIYMNIGSVLEHLNDLSKSAYYTKRAISIARIHNDVTTICGCYANIGRLLIQKNDLSNALKYLDSAKIIARKENLYTYLCATLMNQSQVYKNQNKHQETLSILLSVDSMDRKHALPPKYKAWLLSSLGEAYMHVKKYKTAEVYMQQGWKDSSLTPDTKMFLAHSLAELYATTGNYKKAFNYHQNYHILKDSVDRRDIVYNVNELETKYRTSEKDKELAQNKLRISEQDKKIAQKNFWILSTVATSFVIIFSLLWVYWHIKQKNKLIVRNREIEKLHAKLEGEEEERHRLAQELHDGVNSQLSSAKAYLLAMSSAIPELAYTSSFVQTSNLLDETAKDIRKIAHNLLPAELTRLGLIDALNNFCRTISMENTTAIEFRSYGNFLLPQDISLTIYRIVQELLHNIIKHAKASEAIVLLNELESEISLLVEDNGIGISMENRNHGIGLVNVQNRAQSHEGILTIESKKGNGTVVNIVFPKRISNAS